MVYMCLVTSLSKHFIMMGVGDTGQYSLRQDTKDFFGTRMMVVALKHNWTIGGAQGDSASPGCSFFDPIMLLMPVHLISHVMFQ